MGQLNISCADLSTSKGGNRFLETRQGPCPREIFQVAPTQVGHLASEEGVVSDPRDNTVLLLVPAQFLHPHLLPHGMSKPHPSGLAPTTTR